MLDFAPFRGLHVREFELSHSNLVSRITKITHAHNLHEDVGLCPFFQFVRERKGPRTVIKLNETNPALRGRPFDF